MYCAWFNPVNLSCHYPRSHATLRAKWWRCSFRVFTRSCWKPQTLKILKAMCRKLMLHTKAYTGELLVLHHLEIVWAFFAFVFSSLLLIEHIYIYVYRITFTLPFASVEIRKLRKLFLSAWTGKFYEFT